MFDKLFCSHNYDIIKEYDFKSNFEIIREAGLNPTTHDSLKRKKIIITKCSKCNKIKSKKYYIQLIFWGINKFSYIYSITTIKLKTIKKW